MVRAVDDTQVVRLAGNTPPYARAAADQGAAPADLPLQRMLLVLRRAPAQEADLRQLLDAQRENDSPSYRQWLTPAQFGARFGLAPADLAAVRAWLVRQGFQIDGIAAGGGVIEFSGTAATVAAGLHTQIHRYLVAGVPHWANATDPAIPAALAPAVVGIVSLNDFPKHPASHIAGQGHGARGSPGAPTPSLNFTDQNGVVHHALVPGDLATIYNIAPLFTQTLALNGAGETIALVARSDIEPNDFSSFRQLFQPSAPTTALTTIAAGADPGDPQDGDTAEATLDAEWAGAAAPQAQIDLVVASSTFPTDGVDLAAQYIVDHNLAPVMSTSFGQCESLLGAAENQFWQNLWQQAAAQGITALVSAGDNGAAGCDLDTSPVALRGLAVSGLASTPFDTAVGGTEFNEGGNPAFYWSATNNADFSSVLSYIPEMPWDESALVPNGLGLLSGSGGVSSLYSKPAWQAGPGVPADGQRDLPDLSLSAAGHDGYVVCMNFSCSLSGNGFGFYVFSGTSASSPSLAGMMALVNQQTGARQGLANRVFYKLAAQAGAPSACYASTPPAPSCIFRDTTTGNNLVPCAAGTAGCNSGQMGFSAGPGYDLATGLGSVNAFNLVTQWGSVTFSSSQTALTLSPPANMVHGQSVPVVIQVAPGSGATGTPTGTVELLAKFSDGSVAPVQSFALNASGQVSASTTLLPGGTYNVVATYAGDLDFGTSASPPVSITVGRENASVQLSLITLDSQGNPQPVTTMTYGDPVHVRAVVTGTSGQGEPSGTVTITGTFNGGSVTTLTSGSSIALDGNGSAVSSGLVIGQSGGTNSFTAQYSGDSSFNAAASPAATMSISKAPINLVISTNTPLVGGGTNILNIAVETQTPFLPGYQTPGAELSVYDSSTLLFQTGGGTILQNPTTGFWQLNSGNTLPTLPGTSASLSVQYPGDSNYLPATSNTLSFATPPNLVFNPSALNFGIVSIGAASPPLSATVTNEGGQPDTFNRIVLDGSAYSETDNCGTTLASLASCSVAVTFRPLQVGNNPGTMAFGLFSVPLMGVAPGFTLPYIGTAQFITPGQSATFTFAITPVGGFAGVVNFSCSNLPPLSTCSFSPAAPTLDGTDPVTVQMTVTTTGPPSAAGSPGATRAPTWWWGLLALGVGLALDWRRRRARAPRLSPAVALMLALLAACGGPSAGSGLGGGSGSNPGSGPGNGGAPGVSPFPFSLAFGGLAAGQKSAQSVTLTNSGEATLTFSQISIVPAQATPAGDFTETNTCSAPVAAGSQCMATVTYAPTVGAPESAALTLADNAPGTPQTIPLTGAGVLASTPQGQFNITITGTSGSLTATTTAFLFVN